ncbi:MAG: peptidylprolyl isomerase [Burkholderiaceae bacterium]
MFNGFIEVMVMHCECGEDTGGCGGGRRAEFEAPAETRRCEVLADTEQAAAGSGAPEPKVSRDPQWPRIRVNGVEVSPQAIAQELQYHPANSRDEAAHRAARALVVRELLQQRIAALGLVMPPDAGESGEEAATRRLIEQEIPLPRADEAACRQYYESNRQHFFSAPLLALRHILLACPADDAEARSHRRGQAEHLLAQLAAEPERFAELALRHSDCPSRAQGGALGQISQGQTVPEFERQVFRQLLGLGAYPLESRYGYHLVQVDQRIEGRPLPYEAVAGSIRDELNQRVWRVGVAQYIQGLVGAATIEGIQLQGAATPLLQ